MRPWSERVAAAAFAGLVAVGASAQDTSPAPPAVDEAAAAPAGPMKWELRVDAPEPLRGMLLRYLDVARFQRDAGTESITRAELARLVAATPAQARTLIETEGYFEPEVKAVLEDGTPPVVRIDVQTGPQATVRRLRLEVQGELAQRAEDGEAGARSLLDTLHAEWALPVGAPFRQPDWNAAKGGTLAALRADAYPLATWSGTVAQVDAAQSSVNIFAVADSGPRVLFGDLQIEGLSRYRENTVRNLSPISPGQPYSEKALLDFQERIAKAGLFDSVSVAVEPTLEQADAAPVLVRVRELPKQQATVGVGVSADTGPRLTFEHLHRRPFDFNWQAKSKLELGRDKQGVEFDFTSHPKPGFYRNLASFSATREEASALVVTSQKARVGRTQDTERIERLYYLEWQRAVGRSADLVDRSMALTANYEWVWRNLDSNLLPTRGVSLSAKVGAGRSFMVSGDLDTGSGWFSIGSGRVTGYHPLGSWYGQARLEAGQVFARSDVSVPITLLFRAGGENSVRGYNYQSLGPTVDGAQVGGRVMATASLELARPFSKKSPAWLGAVFVDAGNAAADWDGMKLALGYGVGARWRSPVGPLAIDLAYGHETRKFRLHFSVGITF
jgi:translocation and assembly module TamA